MLNIKNGRWRGQMPFRMSPDLREALRDHLKKLRRGGEPSLAELFIAYREADKKLENKPKTGFTRKMRACLEDWIKVNCGGHWSNISFEYKLSRHKRVIVSGKYIYLGHDPSCGIGNRGFQLHMRVISIDGIPVHPELQIFAWNRIIGKEKMLYLPKGEG